MNRVDVCGRIRGKCNRAKNITAYSKFIAIYLLDSIPPIWESFRFI